MSGDEFVRVRIGRDYAMVSEAGVTVPGGSVVSVPAWLAEEWLIRGWVHREVERPL